MTRSVKLYVVADVDDPPKSVVVITPVAELSEQFACDAFVSTFVVSEKANVLSPVAATVATVPEKLPAIVPREPAPVVQVVASDTVNMAEPDLTALPSLFSTRIKYVPSTGNVKLAVIDVALVNVIVFAAVTAPDQFKSYEDLQKRLTYVLGQRPPARRVDEDVVDEDNTRGSYTPDFNTRKAQETVTSAVSSSSDEDDALSYFQKLAEE